MSHDDIEVIRRQYDAWNRGDISELIRLTHPDFRWVEPPEIVGAEGGAGRNEFEDYLRSFFEVWEEFRWEPREFQRAGELLLVTVFEVGRGRLSGALVGQLFVHVWEIRDGRSIRMERYVDERQALERVWAHAQAA